MGTMAEARDGGGRRMIGEEEEKEGEGEKSARRRQVWLRKERMTWLNLELSI
ncbi:hypothetical protein Droror1_Dr00020337, partial [Drosera rotundifolia]